MVVRRKTTEQFIEEARKVHGDRYDYSKSEYVNVVTKICITCREHGDFWQTHKAHVKQRAGCPSCGYLSSFKIRGGHRRTTEDFIVLAQKVHGDKYDYSKVVYTTGRALVTIICREHGEFNQKASSHLRGAGCAKCAQIKVSGALNNMPLNGQVNKVITTEEFIARAMEVHGRRYDYTKAVYRGGKHKIEIICPKHGSFWKDANNHIRHEQGCPKCKLTKGELAIAVYLEKAAIAFEMQKTFDGLKGKKGGALKFDFYVPSRNMLIEYDGEQHFGCKRFKNGLLSQEQIDNLMRNDMAKEQYAYEHSIALVRIPFTQKNNLGEVLREKVVEAPVVRSDPSLLGIITIQDGEIF